MILIDRIPQRFGQSGSTFDFSFPPRALQSTGDNLGIFMEFADSRTTNFIFPRVDNLVISSGAIPVQIDIKPESSLNSINPANNGVIPVAILSTPTFDAASVDPSTVRFGPNNATALNGKGHLEDVNQDGSLDMVFQFKTQGTGIQCGDIAAQLSGQTIGGEMFSATDSINSVSCN